MKQLLKTKTFYGGVGLIAYGIVTLLHSNYTEGVNSILTGISTIFIRDAIRKNK